MSRRRRQGHGEQPGQRRQLRHARLHLQRAWPGAGGGDIRAGALHAQRDGRRGAGAQRHWRRLAGQHDVLVTEAAARFQLSRPSGNPWHGQVRAAEGRALAATASCPRFQEEAAPRRDEAARRTRGKRRSAAGSSRPTRREQRRSFAAPPPPACRASRRRRGPPRR
jgi:hypothetical protein